MLILTSAVEEHQRMIGQYFHGDLSMISINAVSDARVAVKVLAREQDRDPSF